MDKAEIERKSKELGDILNKYKNDLGTLEKELSKVIEEYHAALKEEKLKDLKASITQTG